MSWKLFTGYDYDFKQYKLKLLENSLSTETNKVLQHTDC